MADEVLRYGIHIRVEVDRQNSRGCCAGRRRERQDGSQDEKAPQNGALQLVRILSVALSLKGDAGRLWKQVAVAMKLAFVAFVLFLAAPATAWAEATLT